MNNPTRLRILLAPLDWGLGHATRCIPIIRYLQQKGCEVVLAADGAPARLLVTEFPGISIRPLRGYKIRYSSGSSLVAPMFLQLPGILRSVKNEHRWLNDLLKKEKFDIVISDNRPGFWSNQTHSIYITHQLLIHSGKGKWLNRILQQLHTRYMKRFTEVWVPDMQGVQNLAGELSHPLPSLIQPTYLGLLSRFEKKSPVEKKYDLIVLLSGPEPQRTILEQKILQQLQSHTGTLLFVRGLPQQKNNPLQSQPHIHYCNHLPASELQEAIASSDLVICRSGYTSLMDLIRLQKKAFLIPTPGQPEQQYLAQYMQEESYFPAMEQTEFDLRKAIRIAGSFPFKQFFAETDFELYKPVIDQLINSKTAAT